MNPYENGNPIIPVRDRGRLAVFRIDVEEQTIFAAKNLPLVTRDATESTRELRAE
jgi:hypothetical protein